MIRNHNTYFSDLENNLYGYGVKYYYYNHITSKLWQSLKNKLENDKKKFSE